MFEWLLGLANATLQQLDDDLYRLEMWVKKLFRRK